MLQELSKVILFRTVQAKGFMLPRFTRGTVVHVYPEGRVYEVELPGFDRPFTLEADCLEEAHE